MGDLTGLKELLEIGSPAAYIIAFILLWFRLKKAFTKFLTEYENKLVKKATDKNNETIKEVAKLITGETAQMYQGMMMFIEEIEARSQNSDIVINRHSKIHKFLLGKIKEHNDKLGFEPIDKEIEELLNN